MKRFKKAIGIGMIISVMMGLFIITTAQVGLTDAIKAWVFAITLTAIIVIGVHLTISNNPPSRHLKRHHPVATRPVRDMHP